MSYINIDCELRLKALNEINVVEQDDEKMITVLEYDDLSDMIFQRKYDSANYLMISTVYLITSSLNILKEDDDLKKKS